MIESFNLMITRPKRNLLLIILGLCLLVGCTTTLRREDIFLQAKQIKEQARLVQVETSERRAEKIDEISSPTNTPTNPEISAVPQVVIQAEKNLPILFTPLPDHEKLVYKTKYLGIPIGDFTIINNGKTTYNGRDAYSFEILVKALPFFLKVFNAKDRYISYMDAKDFVVLRYEEYVDGGTKLESSVDFDYQNHTATYKNVINLREKVVPIPDKVLDVVSGIFYLRMIPWELGDTAEINVYADEKIYDCIGLLQARTLLKLSPNDNEQANILKPYAFHDGKQVKEVSGEVLFSTTKLRKTLKASLKTIFGSVYVVLVDHGESN